MRKVASPVGSSLVTPNLTRTFPFQVTAHAKPEGETEIWLISQLCKRLKILHYILSINKRRCYDYQAHTYWAS